MELRPPSQIKSNLLTLCWQHLTNTPIHTDWRQCSPQCDTRAAHPNTPKSFSFKPTGIILWQCISVLHEKSISVWSLQLFSHLLPAVLQWTESTATRAEHQPISYCTTAAVWSHCTDLMPTSMWASPLLTPDSTKGDRITSIQTQGFVSGRLPLLVWFCRQLSSSRTSIQTPLLLLTAQKANNKYLHDVFCLAAIKPIRKWSAMSSVFHFTPLQGTALRSQCNSG